MHLLTVVALFLTIILALYQLPPYLAGTYRTVKNHWSFRSHQRTVKRLVQLQVELKKLNAPIDSQKEQTIFHNWAVIILSCIAAGAASGTFYCYLYLSRTLSKPFEPSPSIVFLALCVAMFIVASLVGLWGMHHYRMQLPTFIAVRRKQIQSSIESVLTKLNVGEPSEEDEERPSA